MKEYLFDVKLFTSVRVHAADEAAARSVLREAFECADSNFGAWPNGDPICAEAHMDGEADLIEIDGEAV